MQKSNNTLGVIILILVAFSIKLLLLVNLYEWFLMNTFNLPKISLANAFGILIFISNFKLFISKKEENEDYVKVFSQLIIRDLICLLIGLLIYRYFM